MSGSRLARRQARHHRRYRGRNDLNIVPMLDVMVILVFFLIFTAVFSRTSILELSLPAPFADVERFHVEWTNYLTPQAVIDLVASRSYCITSPADVRTKVLDQVREAHGQDVLRDAEIALEVGEAAHAEEGVAHDHQRPPVAEGFECLRDPALHPGEALSSHETHLSASGEVA